MMFSKFQCAIIFSLCLCFTGAFILGFFLKHKQMFMRKKKKKEATEINKTVEEIDEDLKRLLLDTTKDDPKTKERILGLPKEIKLQMIENASRRQKSEQTVESYFEIFETENVPSQKTLCSLLQSLKKNSFVWMKGFLEHGGVSSLICFFNLLRKTEDNERDKKLFLVLEMFEVILTESSKKEHLKGEARKMVLETLCLFAMFEAISIATKAIDILSLFVVDSETSQFVLDILQTTQKKKGATYIFEGICRVKTGLKGFESYLFSFLSFFNKLLFFQEDIVSRFYYRTDFLRSGFEEIKRMAVLLENSKIQICIETFEKEFEKDEVFISKQVKGRLNEKNSDELFALLKKRFQKENEEKFLVSIFSLLLFLPEGKTIREMCLKLIEKKVFETVFEGKKTERSYEDLSMTLVDIRVAELLNKEHELKILCNEKDEKIRNLEQALKDIQNKNKIKTVLDNKQTETKEIKKEIETVPIQQQQKEEQKKEVKSKPPPPPPLKKTIKKKETLKRIMWKPISILKVKETVWAEVEWGFWNKKINEEDLIQCFKSIPKEKPLSKQISKKTFIDEKNGRVIEIAFQGHKISIEVFIEAVQSFFLDSKSLCVISSLLKVVLSKEDKIKLKQTDEKLLNFPDRLFRSLIRIPFYELKLNVISMSRKVNDLFLSVEKALRVYLAAIKRTKYSRHLKVFLALVLYSGNCLNGSSGTSFVRGVEINILTQLPCIKGTDKSFLDFLISAFEKEYQDSDLLKEDLEIMSMGTKMSFSAVKSDIADRLKEFERIENSVLSNAGLEQIVRNEISNIRNKIKRLEKDIEEAQQETKRLSLYFANEKDNCLFTLINDFRRCFVQSKKTL